MKLELKPLNKLKAKTYLHGHPNSGYLSGVHFIPVPRPGHQQQPPWIYYLLTGIGLKLVASDPQEQHHGIGRPDPVEREGGLGSLRS